MLDPFVDQHLNLQVQISYDLHHDFLLRHGLKQCQRVLDVGTGNGTFAARMAADHREIHFVGIDKRRPCIESCQRYIGENFEAEPVDMFSTKTPFDFSNFDGVLMRYFLLHVDHAHKILDLFANKSKRPAKFWVIDLDWSRMSCVPAHPAFDQLVKVVSAFSSKVSVQTRGGENVVPLLEKSGFTNIQVEHVPFTKANVPLADFARYLKQEVLCYAQMSQAVGASAEVTEIVHFLDEDFLTGAFEVSYGMIHVAAELN